MTYRGHVKNGQITLVDTVDLPEGIEVQVELIDRDANDLNAILLRHAGKGRDLPSDLAANHDYYVHGKPQQ
ncbi:MAG: hypothetical protein WD851_08685 [Pirellulales bacterium]